MLGHVCLGLDRPGEWGMGYGRGSRPVGLVWEFGPVTGFGVSWEFGFGETDLGGELGKGHAYGI